MPRALASLAAASAVLASVRAQLSNADAIASCQASLPPGSNFVALTASAAGNATFAGVLNASTTPALFGSSVPSCPTFAMYANIRPAIFAVDFGDGANWPASVTASTCGPPSAATFDSAIWIFRQ